ncbi:MAG TPA: non-canonical purine NTP pyrophosphatase [Thermoplasmata archaeon]|nr:non-canonical purine NTP pyrophosphatase [Thermoplasmata archaeon]
MDLRFVSSNRNKFHEVQDLLRPLGFRVRWTRRELPEPQADRLEPVVRSKLAALPPDGRTYLVEDSGLFLEGLDGFPGVYSAYVYRTIGLAGILRLLEGRPRGAVFRTVAGVRRGPSTWWVAGVSRGEIAPGPRGKGGFGYDPIFIPSGGRHTFAQMRIAEKNLSSHRGRAIRKAGARLLHDVARA